MRSLVYVSSATRLLDETELLSILEVARRNNMRLDITGMLLYQDGNIIQALEGPDDVVQNIYDRIRCDSRHKDVSILINEPILERQFPFWSMGFHNPGDVPVEVLTGYSAFLSNPIFAKAFSQNLEPAYELLLLFRENSLR